MSPQDKATTERHARILRELVKRPENRVCADCKHNGRSNLSDLLIFRPHLTYPFSLGSIDPRWASWNMCVSGDHSPCNALYMFY